MRRIAGVHRDAGDPADHVELAPGQYTTTVVRRAHTLPIVHLSATEALGSSAPR
jgi:hypothetical protein